MKTTSKIATRRRHFEALCRSYHVQILYVFGSRAAEIHKVIRGEGEIEPGRRSDVDMAVRLPAGEALSARKKEELALDLERILGVGRIDLLLLEEADPFLAVNIIRGERLFCIDEFEADEYELYVLRRAGDLAPFERMRIESVLNSPGAG